MSTNLRFWLRTLTSRNEKDVFKNTQGRLTRMYSGMIMLFLILFIVIVYSLVYVIILKNQERELVSLVNQEAGFIQNNFLKNNSLQGVNNQEVVFAGANQFFYYVVSPDGEVMMGNEANPRMRQELINLVTGRTQKEGEIRRENLQVNNHPMGMGNMHEFHPSEEAGTIRLMIASHSISYNGRYIGQLYVGKDITFTYQLFHWLLLILALLGVVFFGVATFMSVVMSKRAMVPITGAFTRQREFVADASHELRTPLSVLLSSIDAMEMTMEPERTQEDLGHSRRLLSNMRQEVKWMTHLVSDLLTLARSDSNTIETKMEWFDFRPQGEKAIASVRPLAEGKQISLSLQAPEHLMAVGDPQRLSQLLYILLDNAIKYTPEGGKVRLSLSVEKQQLFIQVSDTGIGIKPEEQPHIFERFYRADKSRSRQIGGYGLGLSIAKWIVDTHGGTIQLRSEPGKGTTFTVTVPVTPRSLSKG